MNTTRSAQSPWSPGRSRRDFIATITAAAGAGLLAAPAFGQTPERKLRVGIVGGHFGLSFQFHEHPNCVVEAVSDLRPERRESLKKTYRCDKAFQDQPGEFDAGGRVVAWCPTRRRTRPLLRRQDELLVRWPQRGAALHRAVQVRRADGTGRRRV